MRIIKSIGGKNTKTEIDEFDRAISVLKLQEGDIDRPSGDKKIEKFKTFFKEYQAKLREANLIDYDDILIMSVKLLENNPDILEYYQNICEYIIEDEAQDSSGVQQRLIGLLSGKHKNLIRCGDINQAITTTFSNADVEGFRNESLAKMHTGCHDTSEQSGEFRKRDFAESIFHQLHAGSKRKKSGKSECDIFPHF